MGSVPYDFVEPGDRVIYVRTFPLWPEGKFRPDWTYEHFFLRVLPFETKEWKPAGRFNHWKLNLRGSSDGTLVLFVRERQVRAFGRLKGGHHGPDDPHQKFADEEPPLGYFVLDPTTVVFLGNPIKQVDLPWKAGQTSLPCEPLPLDLGLRGQRWYLAGTPEQEKTFFELAERHQPRRPALQFGDR
jgi:hypothetical protein